MATHAAVLDTVLDVMAQAIVQSGACVVSTTSVSDLLQGAHLAGRPLTEHRDEIVARALCLPKPVHKAIGKPRLADDELVRSVRELRSIGLDQEDIAAILGVGVRKVSPHVKDMPLRRGTRRGVALPPDSEKLEEAYRQWTEGAAIPLIAEMLDVGILDVKDLCGHLPRGGKWRGPPPWLEEAQRQWMAGVKPDAIAAQFEVSTNTIRKHCGHLPRAPRPDVTPAWVEVAQRLWMDGILVAEIADTVGRSEATVLDHCQHLPRGEIVPKWVPAAQQKWQSGVPVARIAKEAGVSETAVNYRCWHLPRPGRRKTPPAWFEIAAPRWMAGVELGKIAAECGVSKPTICRHCRHLPRPKPGDAEGSGHDGAAEAFPAEAGTLPMMAAE